MVENLRKGFQVGVGWEIPHNRIYTRRSTQRNEKDLRKGKENESEVSERGKGKKRSRTFRHETGNLIERRVKDVE